MINSTFVILHVKFVANYAKLQNCYENPLHHSNFAAVMYSPTFSFNSFSKCVLSAYCLLGV